MCTPPVAFMLLHSFSKQGFWFIFRPLWWGGLFSSDFFFRDGSLVLCLSIRRAAAATEECLRRRGPAMHPTLDFPLSAAGQARLPLFDLSVGGWKSDTGWRLTIQTTGIGFPLPRVVKKGFDK